MMHRYSNCQTLIRRKFKCHIHNTHTWMKDFDYVWSLLLFVQLFFLLILAHNVSEVFQLISISLYKLMFFFRFIYFCFRCHQKVIYVVTSCWSFNVSFYYSQFSFRFLHQSYKILYRFTPLTSKYFIIISSKNTGSLIHHTFHSN